MRLDKFISAAADVSRSAARSAITRGRVCVDGAVVRSPESQIAEDSAAVTLDGAQILYVRFVYYMMNKPSGVLSASEDKHCKTALDLLKPSDRKKGLFIAGRLDKDTTGFLLITNDGAFAHNILSPKKHVEKTYHVTLERPAEQGYAAALSDGVKIDGTVCKCTYYRQVSDRECVLKITEGKFHEVKRMFEAVGNKVAALKRTAVGGLELDGFLKEGEYRPISDDELGKIYRQNNQK